MTDALNVPVRRARKETISADFPIDQKADIDMPESGQIQREQTIVHASADELVSGTVIPRKESSFGGRLLGERQGR